MDYAFPTSVISSNRVYALQQTILQLFNYWNDFVRHIRDHRWGQVDNVPLIQVILDISRTDSLGVHGDELIVDAR